MRLTFFNLKLLQLFNFTVENATNLNIILTAADESSHIVSTVVIEFRYIKLNTEFESVYI